MIKEIFKQTGKFLTVTSLLLNGLACGNTILPDLTKKGLDSTAAALGGLLSSNKDLAEYIPYVRDGSMILQTLGASDVTASKIPGMVYAPQENFSKLVDSGLLGLGELYCSKPILGQTTHFGLVPQVCKLLTNTLYTADQIKQIQQIALIGMGIFEISYWWSDCDSDESIILVNPD
jgi:hypothetical protein